MNFIEAIQSGFSKYVTWQGRASRSEYWYFQLFFVICVLLAVLVGGDAGAIVFVILYLAIFLPYISVMVRRLHDTNHSGWWYWISLVPVIGAIILLVFTCSRGDAFTNDYGEDPLELQ